jgi:CubicO group peptidase (beta-lactamase class C family)
MTRGTARSAVLALVSVLAVGCSGSSNGTPSGRQTGFPPERDYWPTDAWRTAPPEDHGLDADELRLLERTLTASYPTVRSVVIVRDGHLIYERYRQGLDAMDGHDVRSVTKSVVSALVGIALAAGALESPDQTLGELFADRLPADADPKMGGVTVRHLLSMTSGLPGDDPSLGGDEDVFDRIEPEDDWVSAILGLPLAADPGSEWAYSSASSHLLSVLVADATGGSTLQFARERLFGPLGIDTSDAYVTVGPPTPEELERYSREPVAWPADPQGYHFGGALLKLPARDLAKFGYLYLNEGRWDGEEVIPADYVEESTTPSEYETNAEGHYGWHWWVEPARGHDAYFARGYGGQVIHVVPELDLVTVVTADADALIPASTVSLVTQFVVPAVAD